MNLGAVFLFFWVPFDATSYGWIAMPFSILVPRLWKVRIEVRILFKKGGLKGCMECFMTILLNN
jgi:hypothetical protein